MYGDRFISSMTSCVRRVWGLLLCVAVCNAVILVVPATAQESLAPGRIEGKLTDKRCGIPVVYANVILVGTRMGAITDHGGRFAIENVPPGTYTLNVMALVHGSVSVESITVEAGTAVHRDIEMEMIGRHDTLIDVRDGSGECEVHGRSMGSVLVPVGYGIPANDPGFDSAREAGLPNSNPHHDAGCQVGRPGCPWKAEVFRCRDCVAARNKFQRSDIWDRTATGQYELQTHKLLGVIEIGVPRNAETENVSEPCRESAIVKADHVTVRVVKGDRYVMAVDYPGEVYTAMGDRDAVVIQDGVAGRVDVVESADGVDVYVKFLVTPVDSDAVIMRIQASGDDALSLAAAIVRSVRFSAF